MAAACVGLFAMAIAGPAPATLERAESNPPPIKAGLLQAPTRSEPTAGVRIDLNSASAIELETLPRIGPALAGRIVAHRSANGPFATVDHLVGVKGIGPRTLERLRPYVAVTTHQTQQQPAPEPQPVAERIGVDLNSADTQQLESLPGIGPALAARIIESRRASGPFGSIDELVRVRGIGAKTLEALRPHLAPLGASAPHTSAPLLPTTQPTAPVRFDLNSATAAELETLRGIGPALAARIIESRTQTGPFESVEQLTRVRGIGPKTLESLREAITVGAASQLQPAAPLVPEQATPTEPKPPTAAPSRPLNINAANTEQLQTLRGIGPALSARILADRAERGVYNSATDLIRVRGIGEKTATKLAPMLWFGPADGPAYRPAEGRPAADR